MPDLSRLVVLASTLAAALTHGWLASGRAGIAPAAAAAFAITFATARVSLAGTLGPVLLTAYVAPAVMFVAFDASDYHTTLIWLAALLGPIAAHATLARWHIPGRWRGPFVAWALVIAVSWPIVAGRELDFTLVAARSTELSNAAFEASPRLAAAWITIVALAQMVAILWFDLLWARFSGREVARAERSIIVPLIVSAMLGAVAGLYQHFVDIHWLNIKDWSDLTRSGGLMLDANSFGMSAAIWAPVAVALTWRIGRPWAGVLAYLLLAAGMWTGGSRTALLAFAIGSAGLAIALAQRRGFWQPRMAPIILLVGSALVVLAMAVAPRGGSSPSPLQRVFDRLPRLEAGDVSRFANEMWSRFGYGTAAAEMSADHPLTGVGIGGFHVVSADYIYRALGRRLATDNAQNWWRHQLVELGALGALPALWLSAMLAAVLWRGVGYVEPAKGSGLDIPQSPRLVGSVISARSARLGPLGGLHREQDSRSGPQSGPMGLTTVIRSVLIGLGLASLLGVPTQLPASLVAFLTLLFWLLALPPAAPAVVTDTPEPRRVLAFALAFGVAAGLAMSARGDLRVAVRALRSQVPYHYGISAPEGVSEQGELRWWAARGVWVLAAPNKYLRLTMWAPHTDVATQPVNATVSLNGERVIEHTFTSRDPSTFYVQFPENTRWAVLEFDVSRDWQRDHALQVATTWLREKPP